MKRLTAMLLSLAAAVAWIQRADCFQPPTVSTSSCLSRPRRARREFQLAISEEDLQRDAEFERQLNKDAELWINGDPGKQKLWDKAKAWRRLNQMILAREEAMSELEKDRLRYILKDAQTVTGLPLLNGKEITPLAWCITLTIQFMPLAAFYIIVSSFALDNDPQPVLDASRPFWA